MTMLSGFAGEIEEAIGLEKAVSLLKARGGTRIEVPKSGTGVLGQIIGADGVEALRDAFGHGRLELPMAGIRGRRARDAQVRAAAMRMLAEGSSNREVALACDLSMRSVENYRRTMRSNDDRQLPLLF